MSLSAASTIFAGGFAARLATGEGMQARPLLRGCCGSRVKLHPTTTNTASRIAIMLSNGSDPVIVV